MTQLRRTVERLEIGDVADDQVPVGYVDRRGQHLAKMRDELIAEDDDRVDRGDGEDQRERRQQAARAADPERAQVDALLPIELRHQQRCDQEPADDEEHIDAEEPGRQPEHPGVVEHHRGHRERADTVECRQVGHAPGGARGGHAATSGKRRIANQGWVRSARRRCQRRARCEYRAGRGCRRPRYAPWNTRQRPLPRTSRASAP